MPLGLRRSVIPARRTPFRSAPAGTLRMWVFGAFAALHHQLLFAAEAARLGEITIHHSVARLGHHDYGPWVQQLLNHAVCEEIGEVMQRTEWHDKVIQTTINPLTWDDSPASFYPCITLSPSRTRRRCGVLTNAQMRAVEGARPRGLLGLTPCRWT